jgi:hypothetical protein
MELNTAMRFVMARAQAEAAAAGAKNSTIRIEHVFLGLLKLSELNADDIAPASWHKEQISADIGTVREQLSEQGKILLGCVIRSGACCRRKNRPRTRRDQKKYLRRLRADRMGILPPRPYWPRYLTTPRP